MKKRLLEKLENARQYTLSVANAMPADSYTYTPDAAIWSFNELLHHIGYGIMWWNENYMLQQQADWNPPTVTKDPAATKAYLSECFDALQQSVEKATPDEKIIDGFYATLDHVTHHRGQATVYLRCKGITPPDYSEYTY
ncbi:DinB family protein [Chitinophaga qingshengii]|uniref:DinB family protein n=1 Tax=Chitinophaga qingshengii TaxID=1569794 RepID=A0ABR7TQ54_9BACT|nr:DinB family protein [Chitinophaga qingshengii]MBC9931559.1 DinB family protein [Chitinophaga qingshengii]